MTFSRAGAILAGNCVEGDASLFEKLDSGPAPPEMSRLAIDSCVNCDRLPDCSQPDRLAYLARYFADAGVKDTIAGGVHLASQSLEAQRTTVEAELDTSTPATALASMRHALREGLFNTKGNHGEARYPERARRFAVLHEACSQHDDPFVRETSYKDLRLFTFLFDRLHAKLGAPEPARGELFEAALLYLEDAKKLHGEGAYNPYEAGLFHDFSILQKIRDACADYYFLDPHGNDPPRILEQSPRTPLEKTNDIITKFEQFRNEAEPQLRRGYGYTGSAWSDSFLKYTCMRVTDVEGYFREWLDDRKKLVEAFPDCPAINIDALLCGRGMKKKIFAAIEEQPIHITLEEAQLRAGYEKLEAALQARRQEAFDISSGTTWQIREIVRQMRANKHLYANTDINVTRAASFIVDAARYLESQNGADRILSDLHMFAAVFRAYASNVEELRASMNLATAQNLATSITPAEHRRLVESYSEALELSRAQTHQILVRDMSNPERKLQTFAAIRQRLQQVHGKKLDAAEANALITNHSVDEDETLKAAELYVSHFPDLYSEISQKHRWVSRERARRFFLEKDNPIQELHLWIERVEYAKRKIGNGRYPTYSSLGYMMYREGNPDDIINGYLTRAAYLKEECAKRKLQIPPYYLSHWAARYARGYKSCVGNHSSVCKKLQEIFEENGVRMDAELLSDLAFKNPVLSKAGVTAERFLAVREKLAQGARSNSWVQQWMIDSAARRGNVRDARKHLAWLVHLASMGKLTVKGSREVGINDKIGEDGSREYQEVLANSDIGPEDLVIEQMVPKRGAEDQLEEVLSSLTPMEAAAVRAISGIQVEHDLKDIAEGVGFDVLLEYYVKSGLIPKLRANIDGSTQGE